jgi:hypothetical protein
MRVQDMRKALLFAAGVAAMALVFGFSAFGSSHSKPSLRITPATRLTVQGRHVRPSEVVRLRSGSRFARAKANGSGYFVVAIPGADRCNTARVVATGWAGSYAIVKLLPPKMCLPVRSWG